MADRFCPNCGAPQDPNQPANYCPSCGTQLAGAGASNKPLLISLIAAGVVVIILIAIVIWALTRNNSTAGPAVTTTSASPTASDSPAAGWQIDTTGLNTTIPARPGDAHGCLSEPVSLTAGKGVGLGVIGNGMATTVDVVAAPEPQVGAPTAVEPKVQVIALSCSSVDNPVTDGVMIDLAVLSGGQLLPTSPANVFDSVSGAISSSIPEYFPVFDQRSLKLSVEAGVLTFTGKTVPAQGQVHTFVVGIHPQPNGDVTLATSAFS